MYEVTDSFLWRTMISYLQCEVKYLMSKSGLFTAIAQTNKVGDFKDYSRLVHIIYN